MKDIKEALKLAGFEISDKVQETENKLKPKLPFYRNIKKFSDDELLNSMDFINSNKFRITLDEIKNMECSNSKNIKNLLIRNFDKLYAIEMLPNINSDISYDNPGIFIYFKYSYIAKEFSVSIDNLFADVVENVLMENDIPQLEIETELEKRAIPLAFHIVKHCDEILLYIKDKHDSLIYYPNIPFKFSRIQQDAIAMERLKPFLESCSFKPNPNSYYYIDKDYGTLNYLLNGKPYYYLRKAINKDIKGDK